MNTEIETTPEVETVKITIENTATGDWNGITDDQWAKLENSLDNLR